MRTARRRPTSVVLLWPAFHDDDVRRRGVVATPGASTPRGSASGPDQGRDFTVLPCGDALALGKLQAPTRQPEGHMELKKIIVPLDGSTLAETSISAAVQIAKDQGGTLVLVRAVEAPWLHGDGIVDAQVRVVHDAEEYLGVV